MSMRIDKQVEAMEARKSGGRFFRLMLREVKPEHVPDMIHMLWLFGHGGKELLVPKVGRWLMKMPHGYALVGEGPVGVAIEPPPYQEAIRAGAPHGGDQIKMGRPAIPVPKLDEHDTKGVIALCELARHTAKPERDQVITRIFALNLDRCRPRVLDVVELLIYDLIAK